MLGAKTGKGATARVRGRRERGTYGSRGKLANDGAVVFVGRLISRESAREMRAEREEAAVAPEARKEDKWRELGHSCLAFDEARRGVFIRRER